MPRFVILFHHEIESPHWDLMLENGDRLATWQIQADPKNWPDKPTPCRRIFDHRKKYLAYEGPLSNHRGQVKQFAAGDYIPQKITDTLWEVMLQSQPLTGALSLTHINDDQWQLTFKPA